METIIKDGLPMGAFSFQPTLSNGTRPDCTVKMPNGAPDLVIDAKFPLEAWNAMREAQAEALGDQALQAAQQRFRRDMEVHIRDISEKYLIAGEPRIPPFCSCRRNRSSPKFTRPRRRSCSGRTGRGW
jgi:DNA recombination protein RmuC